MYIYGPSMMHRNVVYGPVWGSFWELLGLQEAPKATIYPKRGRFSNQQKAAEASFTLQAKKLLRTSFPSFCSDRRHPSPAHISARAPPPRRPLDAPPLHAGRRSSSPPRRPPLLPSALAARSSSPPCSPTALLPSARPDGAAAPPLHAGGVHLLPSALAPTLSS